MPYTQSPYNLITYQTDARTSVLPCAAELETGHGALDVVSNAWPMKNPSKQTAIRAASHPLNLPAQPHICLFTATRLSQLSHSLFSKCKKGDSKTGYSWIEYSYANKILITQKVVSGAIYPSKPNFRILRSQIKIKGKLIATYTSSAYRANVSSALNDSPHTFTLIK